MKVPPHPGTSDRISKRMSRIPRAGTRPEVEVGRASREVGLNVRQLGKGLPGTPDLVSRGKKLAIFVHGCFWHGHTGCERAKVPRTNTWWWRAKINENRQRDARKEREIKDLGYRVVIVWECELADMTSLKRKLRAVSNSLPLADRR